MISKKKKKKRKEKKRDSSYSLTLSSFVQSKENVQYVSADVTSNVKIKFNDNEEKIFSLLEELGSMCQE